MENWKDIEGYKGFYQVSNLGRVKSVDRYKWNCKGNQMVIGIILKQKEDSTKYYKVGLYKNGVRKDLQTHRLVAQTFLPMFFDNLEVNHINGNPRDNRVENLEWVTHRKNMEHASKNKLFDTQKRKQMHIERQKPVMMIGLDNVELLWFDSIKEASEMTNTNYTNISMCCNGKRKTSGGYKWRFY